MGTLLGLFAASAAIDYLCLLRADVLVPLLCWSPLTPFLSLTCRPYFDQIVAQLEDLAGCNLPG
jgi:hypothetical protein